MVCSKYRISDPLFALFAMAVAMFFSGATNTYINSVLTTLEKRFSFNTMELGVLMGSNDIGYLSSIIFVTYFGSMKNRQPFMLFLSGVVSWISCMVYIIPYFIYGPKYTAETLLNINRTAGHGLCMNSTLNLVIDKTSGDEINSQEKSIAFAILIIAGILSGISSTPLWCIGISFLDDLAGPAKSGIYIGALYVTRTLSPIIGYLIGSRILEYHESLNIMVDQYSPGQKDLKWIGAWWLGWLIFGFCVLIPAPLMLFVTRKKTIPIDNSIQKENLLNGDEYDKKENNNKSLTNSDHFVEANKTLFKDLIDLVHSLKKTVQNKIFNYLVIGTTFEIISFVCLITFFNKYLEYHFRVSASTANIMSAICLAGSRVMSSAISGIISHYYKSNLKNTNRFHMVVNVAALIPYPLLFFFTCPSTNILGLQENSTISMGSNHCNCQIKNMDPICYNSKSIFSPCLAGCKTRINETFYSQCGFNHNEFAVKGFCESMCLTVYGFLIILFILRVVGSIAGVQYTQMLMRIANPDQKAMNLSIISLLYGICGLVLPPLTGRVLDTACKHRNVNKFGIESHCILYDNDKMRNLILGISFGLQIPACFFYVLSWLSTPADYEERKQSRRTSKIEMTPT